MVKGCKPFNGLPIITGYKSRLDDQRLGKIIKGRPLAEIRKYYGVGLFGSGRHFRGYLVYGNERVAWVYTPHPDDYYRFLYAAERRSAGHRDEIPAAWHRIYRLGRYWRDRGVYPGCHHVR